MNHQLSNWDPAEEFRNFKNNLSSFFSRENGSQPLSEELATLKTNDWNPSVDISEDNNEYLIVADLPQVKKEEIKLDIHNGVLSISGERKSESETKDKKRKYHRIERSYGSYQRTFRLPENVAEDKVEAQFDDGVLSVHLPKCDIKPHKHVEIN